MPIYLSNKPTLAANACVTRDGRQKILTTTTAPPCGRIPPPQDKSSRPQGNCQIARPWYRPPLTLRSYPYAHARENKTLLTRANALESSSVNSTVILCYIQLYMSHASSMDLSVLTVEKEKIEYVYTTCTAVRFKSDAPKIYTSGWYRILYVAGD